ncbi:MAG TPA: hypothetical protein P5567_14860 [Kiritimatiellia bacterium]|nr:hypothetical protein [Kiritimatiellia bacterium]HSA19371.1 hypothetical protein [Kiritimatiellia bacterium]
MKTSGIEVVLSILWTAAVHAQTCDKEPFLSAVNEAWVQTNYAQIHQIVDDRLSACTNDLFGLCLNYGYYFWARVDFTNAQMAAQQFVLAVSNRAPHEVMQPGIVMDHIKSVADMAAPVSIPTNQARSEEQIQYLHTVAYPTNFPEIYLYLEFVSRVETNE